MVGRDEHGNGLKRTASVLDLILKSVGVIAAIGAILSGLLYVQLQPVRDQLEHMAIANANTQEMVERYMANRRNIDSLVSLTLRYLTENEGMTHARLSRVEKRMGIQEK